MATTAEIWGYVLASGRTADDLLVQAHLQVTEVYRMNGLDASSPLTVGPTVQSAGDLTQTISQVGDATTVTRV